MSARESSPHAKAEQRLAQELALLRRRRNDLAASLSDRDPVGDTADNANALERADDLAWLDDRIAELAEKLATWNSTDRDSESALADGTEVTLRFGDGSEETFQVVAITAEIAEGAEDTTLTRHSALGRALAGHAAGDDIHYTTPEGDIQATIVTVHEPRRTH